MGTKEAEQLTAIVACQGVKYDAYARTLATADADRATKLKAIAKLIDDKLAPARGKAGARCEKALSNGTFRDKRNPETVCDRTLLRCSQNPSRRGRHDHRSMRHRRLQVRIHTTKRPNGNRLANSQGLPIHLYRRCQESRRRRLCPRCRRLHVGLS